MIMLPLQRLFQIIHRPKINIKIGHQEALSSTNPTTEMEDMESLYQEALHVLHLYSWVCRGYGMLLTILGFYFGSIIDLETLL